MGNFITHKELADVEDKLNGKIDRSMSEQNQYRHDQTEVINVRFISMDEKLDTMINDIHEIKQLSKENSVILHSHMATEEKTLIRIEKAIETKTDWKFFYATVAAAMIIFAVIWSFILIQDGKNDEQDSRITILEQKIDSIPKKVTDSLKQEYNINN